jgi:simple sugar transport system ATP-binding protein
MVAEQHAVIFISHKLHEVLAISQRVTVLRDGHRVASKDTAGSTKANLAQMMVGREIRMRPDKAQVARGAVLLELQDVEAQNDLGTAGLRGVSLQVHAGEILGLAGVSGNGQRELADVVCGLRAATAGKILLKGQDVTGQRPGVLTHRGLSYIPEERMKDGMVQQFSISENVILRDHDRNPFAERGFMRHGVIGRFTDKLIQAFNVKTPSRETQARHLSGGNIQKVVLARELSRDPEVLIAAQPSRGLDIGATEYVHAQLLIQRQQGMAILLISEDLDEILGLSDRIAVIYEGRIMGVIDGADATPEQLGLLMAGVQEEPVAAG